MEKHHSLSHTCFWYKGKSDSRSYKMETRWRQIRAGTYSKSDKCVQRCMIYLNQKKPHLHNLTPSYPQRLWITRNSFYEYHFSVIYLQSKQYFQVIHKASSISKLSTIFVDNLST